jgi:hypothetical protein
MYLGVSGLRRRQSQTQFAALLWILLGAGMLLQGFSPHLQIRNDAFYFPSSYVAGGKKLDPAPLIKRQRWMQASSALLLFGATVGLGRHYRHLFLTPRRSAYAPPGA